MASPVNHVPELSTSSTFTEATTIAAISSSFVSSSNTSAGLPKSIPAPNPSGTRSLVLCFDGTGDQFDSDNSNIVEFFRLLKKDNRDQQMVYYQAGIGTYTPSAVATPLTASISKMLDQAVAWNLSAHVMDGYEFLMQTYKAGDRICIFGFSRGAYTARGLAGMIHKVGLLPACNIQQVPFAYKMYSRTDETGWKQSNAFKKAFSVDVPIEFIGVWDTVNSVGIIPHHLPFTTSNTIVRTFRHAVSLDERRAKFKANLWNRPNIHEATLGVQGQKPDATVTQSTAETHKKGFVGTEEHNSIHALEHKYSEVSEHPTDIEEVWFAGVHTDVGGGSVVNGTPHTLARIALRWMIRECFKRETGIIFISEDLRSVGLDPTTLYPFVQKRPPPLPVGNAQIQSIPSSPPLELENFSGVVNLVEINKSEEEHELLDALSPIYDQLILKPMWWILEMFPVKQPFQRGDDSWSQTYVPNLGRGRFIPKQKKQIIKIHRSVQLRMDSQYPDGTKYKPKASFDAALAENNVQWVD